MSALKVSTSEIQSTYLVGVDLDDNTLVHVRAMTIIVLLRIVGVNSVGHVGTDQVTLGQSLQVSSGGVAGLGLAVVGGQAETLKGAGQQVRVGTVGSVGSDLLVVEKRDETDVGVVGQRVSVLQTPDQSLGFAI